MKQDQVTFDLTDEQALLLSQLLTDRQTPDQLTAQALTLGLKQLEYRRSYAVTKKEREQREKAKHARILQQMREMGLDTTEFE